MNKVNIFGRVFVVLVVFVLTLMSSYYPKLLDFLIRSRMLILLVCLLFTYYQWRKYRDNKNMRWWIYTWFAMACSLVVLLVDNHIGMEPLLEIVLVGGLVLSSMVFLGIHDIISKRQIVASTNKGSIESPPTS